MNKDLEGIQVITLEQAVAAPYASGKLAQAGARVIKIERAEGDFARRYDSDVNGLSAYFVWLNHGKESVCLNIKDAEDLLILKNIISKSDIFIQNLMPGATNRIGISSKSLREKYPSLITCDISGYGQSGPYSKMKAYDLLIQAESGLANINGSSQEPGRVGVSVCDIAAGMTSFQAILQALIGRNKTGLGRGIEVSLFHSLSDWMNVPYLQTVYGKRKVKRAGLHHATIAPYGVYKCRQDELILISIQNEREWSSLCSLVLKKTDLIEKDNFSNNSNRVINRNRLDQIINDVFGSMSRKDIIKRLQDADIAYGQLSTVEDLADHPQSNFISVQTSEGEISLLSPGAVINGEEVTFGKVPFLGEHTNKIKNEYKNLKND
ncbi:MAG: CaiB/BaiF CoA transferase family protein [Candidatus Puniceispirillales bacterium]